MPFKVTVNYELCDGCETCVQVCPVQVYEMQEVEVKGQKKRVSVPVRAEDCIGCLACVSQCPTQAITVEEVS